MISALCGEVNTAMQVAIATFYPVLVLSGEMFTAQPYYVLSSKEYIHVHVHCVRVHFLMQWAGIFLKREGLQ